jgi:hypothetical protein
MSPQDLIAWIIVGLLCVIAVLLFAGGILMVFRGGEVITFVRQRWERGELRTPDGQFKMNPTLDEARRWAGARGEPAYTAPPVIVPDGQIDAIDESVNAGISGTQAVVNGRAPLKGRISWRLGNETGKPAETPD